MSDHLSMWVICRHPSNFPGHYTTRETRIVDGEVFHRRFCHLGETLQEARAGVPAGRTNIGRMPEDDPCIVEVWL